MGSQVKRATFKIGMGLLALASISAGAMASDVNLDNYHLQMVGGGDSSQATDLSGYTRDLVPTVARVTIPRVSGVELFSNQAIFSLGATSFSENKGVSFLHQNAEEAQFWQATTITSSGTTTIGAVSVEELAMYDRAAAHSLAVKPSNMLGATINDTGNFSPSSKQASNDLGIPTLNAGGLISGPSSVLPASTSLNSVPTASAAIAKQEPLANPEMSRDVSGPEPASIGLLGVFAVGLLGRRRAR